MATQSLSHASESLKQYVEKDQKGKLSLTVPEGKYKGWVPRIIYSMHLEEVSLPFLKLASFPVGGTSIGNLVGMRTFSAVGNYLHQLPKSFGNCKSMEKLDISFNHFEMIPASVFLLESLVELDCSDNELKELSPDIGALKNLRILKLSGNILSEIPEELGKCKKIEHLLLSRKWYPREGGLKELPKAACSLKSLQYLDVSWHQINTIPDEVGNLTKLETLNMRGNFLKYVSTNIANCTNLRDLNLTGAMKLNSYIPTELFSLSELRTLNISNNYFSEISGEVKGLKKIQRFIMRCNALLRLPDELFDLKNLEVLELGDNYLEELPPIVSKLKKLKTLELQGNKLSSLPNEICKCHCLEQLFLSFNKMTSLPEEVYQLVNLKELDLHGNQLKQLPMMMDKLENLGKTGLLNLTENYLTKPPQEICNQGVTSLFKYLSELRISEAKHRRKMILIGAAKAGKTSLRNALILNRSKLTLEHERTWVLERHLWEPESDLRVQILDFGGHHIYSAAHHMFLTPEALHVVVFDLSKYIPEKYDALIGSWIDAIMDRAPGATIKIVGTHSDLCSSDEIEEILEDIQLKMNAIENRKMTDLKITLVRLEEELQSVNIREAGTRFEDIKPQRTRERRAYVQKMLNTRSTLPTVIDVVSCAEALTGVFEFRSSLQKALKDSDEKPLPKPWFMYLQAIQERTEKILHFEQSLHIFKDLMNTLNKSMISLEGSAESSLEMVLRYLHATGEIVWYYENPKLKSIVFHRPETLVEMLRTIFRHDFDKVVVYNDTLGRLAGLNEKKFDAMKENFLTQGLMTLELLHFCILHFKLTVEARDMFVDLMLKFDLCYEVPKITGAPATFASNRILKFPWFLSTDTPSEVFRKWPTKTPRDTIELCFQLQFAHKSPPNFFEKMSARLQNHVLNREDWKDGTLAFRNRSKLLMTREQKDDMTVVMVAVRGSDLQELWYLLLNSYHDMIGLLQEWPFVHFEQYLLCSHCIFRGEEEPHEYPAEVLEARIPKKIYQLQCCPKQEGVYIPASLVYPLDPDFEDDIAEHIKMVKEFLQSLEDTVDGTGSGLLSDLGLSYLATKLGAEWSLVVRHLELTQAEIEQIQMDNPNQVVKQITIALIRWRDRQINLTDDKLIKKLFDALKCNELQSLVDDIRDKYGMGEETDDEETDD